MLRWERGACSKKAEGGKGSPAKRSKGAAPPAEPQGAELQDCKPALHGSHHAAGGLLKLAVHSPLRQHCLCKTFASSPLSTCSVHKNLLMA